MGQHRSIGNRIAPTRFLLFFAVLLGGVVIGAIFTALWLGVMLGFDVAAIVFIISCIGYFSHSEHDMRDTAARNDANRAILLVLSIALTVVVLVAVGSQMATDRYTSALDVIVVCVTLLLAWSFANTVYALHYAHLFYTHDDNGQPRAGILFPDDPRTQDNAPAPEFADFVYFSFCIGCTLAVSDTAVTSPHIRKVVTGQSVAGFVYNIGVFALTVNLLAGRG